MTALEKRSKRWKMLNKTMLKNLAKTKLILLLTE
jgi:hypothetical protein